MRILKIETEKEMGCMLSLAKITKWMHGIFDETNEYGLPDSVYDDVVPSGVHFVNHSEF